MRIDQGWADYEGPCAECAGSGTVETGHPPYDHKAILEEIRHEEASLTPKLAATEAQLEQARRKLAALERKAGGTLCLQCNGEGQYSKTFPGSHQAIQVPCVVCESTGLIRKEGSQETLAEP